MNLGDLIQFILNQIKHMIPIASVHQFQNGVMFRFGRYRNTLLPGWHFKFPYADTFAVENITDTTSVLPAQSITSADGEQMVVRGIVGWKISDIKQYFLNGYDIKSLVSDNACLVVSQQCSNKVAEEVVDIHLAPQLRKLLQAEVNQYGITINFLALIDASVSSSLRLFNETLRLES